MKSKRGKKSLSYLVKDIMTKDIMTIDVHDSVLDAAEAIVRDPQATGYVVVLQKQKPVGIVTERDIIRNVVIKQLTSDAVPVSTIMSTPLVTIDPDADFLMAPERMQEHNVSQLVVVKDGVLQGVITMKIVATQCNTFVHQIVRDMAEFTKIGVVRY
jgi:CBS domain-containing protein